MTRGITRKRRRLGDHTDQSQALEAGTEDVGKTIPRLELQMVNIFSLGKSVARERLQIRNLQSFGTAEEEALLR